MNWIQTSVLYGQRVRTERGKLVYATKQYYPYFYPEEPVFVYPDIGEKMNKTSRQEERAEIPPHPLGMFRIFQRALCPELAGEDECICVVCTDHHARQCSLCGIVVHDHCGRGVANSASFGSSGPAVLENGGSGPLQAAVRNLLKRAEYDVVLDNACPLCSNWLRMIGF
eukprot:434879-Pyramimonas_sp.AAC.1